MRTLSKSAEHSCEIVPIRLHRRDREYLRDYREETPRVKMERALTPVEHQGSQRSERIM